MTGQRRAYVIALVAAVLALVVSLGAAMTFMTYGNSLHLTNSTPVSNPDGWRQGLAGDGWMDQGRGGGGMMGDWNDQGDPDAASVTPEAAKSIADAWAVANQPGATMSAGVQMPMGYLFTVTEDGRNVGTIIVNDDTGQVG